MKTARRARVGGDRGRRVAAGDRRRALVVATRGTAARPNRSATCRPRTSARSRRSTGRSSRCARPATRRRPSCCSRTGSAWTCRCGATSGRTSRATSGWWRSTSARTARARRAAHGDLSLRAMGRDLAAVLGRRRAGRGRRSSSGIRWARWPSSRSPSSGPELFGPRIAGVVLIGAASSDLLRGAMGSVTELLRPRLGLAARPRPSASTALRKAVLVEPGRRERRRRALDPVRAGHAEAGGGPRRRRSRERTASEVWTDALPELMEMDLRHAVPRVRVPALVRGGRARSRDPAGRRRRAGRRPARGPARRARGGGPHPDARAARAARPGAGGLRPVGRSGRTAPKRSGREARREEGAA